MYVPRWILLYWERNGIGGIPAPSQRYKLAIFIVILPCMVSCWRLHDTHEGMRRLIVGMRRLIVRFRHASKGRDTGLKLYDRSGIYAMQHKDRAPPSFKARPRGFETSWKLSVIHMNAVRIYVKGIVASEIVLTVIHNKVWSHSCKPVTYDMLSNLKDSWI